MKKVTDLKVYGNNDKRIHSFVLFILMMICIIPVLTSFYFEIIIPCSVCLIMIAFFNRLKLTTALLVFISIIPFGISMFAMQYLYPNNDVTLKAAHLIQTFFSIQSFRLAQSVTLMLRIVLLSYVSIIAMLSLDISYFINYLMEKKILSPLFGFPIFIALHSIKLFKEEYERIMIIAKIRKIKGVSFFYTLLPLLVFALRFSQRAAISLELRGLTKDRVPFFTYKLKLNDIILLYVSTVIILFFIIYSI